MAAMLSNARQRFKPRPGDTIAGVDPSRNFPSAQQPIAPIGPPGAEPLGTPYLFGQNQTFNPRFDLEYSAADLRRLGMYPLARICIENVKNQICKSKWSIRLRRIPGEHDSARNKRELNDATITKISKFMERPNPDESWSEWSRRIVEDMLAIDAPATLLRRTRGNGRDIRELRYVPGDSITRYIDDNGWTPPPPSPAYAQLWQGIPRVNLTTSELVYKPRNIVPRNSASSYLYGCSPTETLAAELEIGIARLVFIKAYYDKGSIPGVLQVVPLDTPPAKILETMQWMNSELAGNLEARRQWRMIQGFNKEGKPDQVLFPKEPLLSDPFDDLHIRKVAFGYGTAPQRLMKPMNRGSAQSGQIAAEEEGLLPFQDWLATYANFILQVQMGHDDYTLEFENVREIDPDKQADIDIKYAKEGIRPRNEIRADKGWDSINIPEMNEPGQFAANGFMPITLHGPAFNEPGGDGNISNDAKRVPRIGEGDSEKVTGRIVKFIRDEAVRMIEDRRGPTIVIDTRKDKESDARDREDRRKLLAALLLIDWSELGNLLVVDYEAIAEDAAVHALHKIGIHASGVVATARQEASKRAVRRAAELVGMKRTGDVLVSDTDAVKAISKTTADAIKKMVEDAIANDTPLDELALEFGDAGIFSAERAAIIAETEAQTAVHFGNYAAWEASGVVEAVQWSLNPDHPENCPCDCDFIASNSPYSLADLPDYPQHPHEMCILTPVVAGVTKARRRDTLKLSPKAIQAEYSIKQKVERFLSDVSKRCVNRIMVATTTAGPHSPLPVNGKVNGAAHV